MNTNMSNLDRALRSGLIAPAAVGPLYALLRINTGGRTALPH